MEIQFNGHSVKVIEGVTLNCNDHNTYVFKFNSVICWTEGKPWNGFATSTPVASGFKRIADVSAALEVVAKDEYAVDDDVFACTRRDLAAIQEYAQTWLDETLFQMPSQA